jgi:DNA-binding NtrC family response regulator
MPQGDRETSTRDHLGNATEPLQISMLSYHPVDHLIGESPWTQQIRERILQVSGYRYSVLVTGPSGTGKELVARAIHTHGPRADKPFICVNCAALPSGLFASQLFGHLKGAFTGAAFNSLGCFRAAEGGTIFLDEIGDLELDLQAKLLRVIQERKVVPVGSHEGIPVDVRIVAATNRNLDEEVRAGRFRLDLYYRLNVVSVETAALASRREDIAVLAEHFLAKAAVENGEPTKRLTASALALLEAYDWPGNIRQLQNLLEGAVVFTRGHVIGPDAFPQIVEVVGAMRCDGGNGQVQSLGSVARGIRRAEKPSRRHGHNEVSRGEVANKRFRFDVAAIHRADSFDAAAGESQPTVCAADQLAEPAADSAATGWMTLADVELEHIRRTLQEVFFNQSAAARLLGIDRKLLARKIKKLGLQIPTQGARRVSQ